MESTCRQSVHFPPFPLLWRRTFQSIHSHITGTGGIRRNLWERTSPVVKISKKEKQYTIETTTDLKSLKVEFELGKEFEQELFDERRVKTVVVAKDGNLLETFDANGVKSELTWSADGTSLNVVYNAGDVVSIRSFVRQ